MKKISIDKIKEKNKLSIRTEDKYFWVYLGNNVKRCFSNKKNADAFITKVNTKLNIIVDQLNYLVLDVYRIYRTYFRSFSTGACAGVSVTFSDIDNQLIRAINSSQSVNGNHFTFINLGKALEMLKSLVELLIAENKKMNNWHEKRMLEAILSRLDDLKTDLANIGRE